MDWKIGRCINFFPFFYFLVLSYYYSLPSSYLFFLIHFLFLILNLHLFYCSSPSSLFIRCLLFPSLFPMSFLHFLTFISSFTCFFFFPFLFRVLLLISLQLRLPFPFPSSSLHDFCLRELKTRQERIKEAKREEEIGGGGTKKGRKDEEKSRKEVKGEVEERRRKKKRKDEGTSIKRSERGCKREEREEEE